MDLPSQCLFAAWRVIVSHTGGVALLYHYTLQRPEGSRRMLCLTTDYNIKYP